MTVNFNNKESEIDSQTESKESSLGNEDRNKRKGNKTKTTTIKNQKTKKQSLDKMEKRRDMLW